MSRPTTALILLFALTLAWAVGSGCNGKGIPGMSEILNVSPTGVLGATNDSIQFFATVDTPGAYSLSWNWGSGTDPSSAMGLAPTVTLATPGTYNASVNLLVDDVIVDTFPFEYTVQGVPVISGVAPTGSVGLPNGEVQFSATASNNPTGWIWTFESPIDPGTSTEESPVVTLPDPGTYTGSVAASNSAGSSLALNFQFTVDQPVAPNFAIHDIGLARTSPSTGSISATVHQGKLAILYSGIDGLRVALAKVAAPCCASQWDTHLISDIGLVGGSHNIVSRNDRLVITYITVTDEFTPATRHIAVSDVSQPTSLSDWTILDINSGVGVADVTAGSALHEDVSGGLWIIYLGGSDGATIGKTEASVPDSLGAWTTSGIATGDELGFSLTRPSLADHEGRIWIGFSEGSFGWFGQMTDSDPFDPGNWNFSVSETVTGDLRSVFVYVKDDQPALLYKSNTPSFRRVISIREATEPEPDGPGDWNLYNVLSPDAKIRFGQGGIIAGRAWFLVEETENRQLVLWRQVGANSTAASAWSAVVVDTGGEPGAFATAVLLDARIAVVYFDSASGMLRTALADSIY